MLRRCVSTVLSVTTSVLGDLAVRPARRRRARRPRARARSGPASGSPPPRPPRCDPVAEPAQLARRAVAEAARRRRRGTRPRPARSCATAPSRSPAAASARPASSRRAGRLHPRLDLLAGGHGRQRASRPRALGLAARQLDRGAGAQRERAEEHAADASAPRCSARVGVGRRGVDAARASSSASTSISNPRQRSAGTTREQLGPAAGLEHQRRAAGRLAVVDQHRAERPAGLGLPQEVAVEPARDRGALLEQRRASGRSRRGSRRRGRPPTAPSAGRARCRRAARPRPPLRRSPRPRGAGPASPAGRPAASISGTISRPLAGGARDGDARAGVCAIAAS